MVFGAWQVALCNIQFAAVKVAVGKYKGFLAAGN
jgi:hypothetical protein